MSQENVEVVRSIHEAFNRDDLNAMFRDMHVDFELTFPGAPNPGPHRGRKEVEARIEDGIAAYGAASYEVEDLRGSGEQVAALVKVRVQPKGTTAEIENRVGHVWRIRAGKAV